MSENPSSVGAAPLAATQGAGRVDALDPLSLDDVVVTGDDDTPRSVKAATSSGAGAFRRLLRTPLGITALSADAILILLAIFAPIIWGNEAMTNDLTNINAGPSAEHWFGTDNLGRDILARVLVATRLSLELALAATAIGLIIGVLLGAVPSVLGRRFGRFFTSAVNIAVAFPGLLLALFFAIIFGAGPVGATFALGLATAPGFARLTQTLAASVAGRDFVAAARTLGIGRIRILNRHVLPNIAEPLIVNGTLGAGGVLLSFAGLSFLGLGVQLPSYDWGRLLGEGLNKIYTNPMAALAPGLAVLLAGLAFNLTGEASAQLAGRRVGRSAKAERRLRAAVATTIEPAAPPAIGPGPARSAPAAVSTSPTGRTSPSPSAPSGPVLDIADLTVSFPVGKDGVITPVRGVSLRLERGESIGIVGESGSGKSLTALAIAQLVTPPGVVSARRLQFEGTELQTTSEAAQRDLLGNSMAMVFQDPMSSLNPTKKVGKQLAEVATEHQGASKSAAWSKAVARLQAVRIPAAARRAKQYPFEFSGGMRQRAMIGMGLMGNPSLLIADEPTTALDVTVQQQVLQLMVRVRADAGAGLLLISHDVSVIASVCDRVVVMYAGKVVEELTVEALLDGPAHPYTRALLTAVPNMDTPRDQPLTTIPGRPPLPTEFPVGCAYAARCPFADQLCLAVDPALTSVPHGGRAACHHPQTGPVVALAEPAIRAGSSSAQIAAAHRGSAAGTES
jgi:oligopeptide/dipeptide ABC transporter ATP-binding protein